MQAMKKDVMVINYRSGCVNPDGPAFNADAPVFNHDSAPTEHEMLNVPSWNFETDTKPAKNCSCRKSDHSVENNDRAPNDTSPTEAEMLGVPVWNFDDNG